MIWECYADTGLGHVAVRVHDELHCIPEYSRLKCETVLPTAQAWLKPIHSGTIKRHCGCLAFLRYFDHCMLQTPRPQETLSTCEKKKVKKKKEFPVF